jgi:hypothetical protein
MDEMTDDRDLEELFGAGRAALPPDRLLQRITAEGRALQPRPGGPAPVAAPGRRRAFFEAFGGWRMVGGLTASVAAGFWLGLADPGGYVAALGAGETVELLPGADAGFAAIFGES